MTGGNGVKYVESFDVSLFLIVLAAYSCLSEASQHGTILCPST